MAGLGLGSWPWGTTKHWRSFPPMAPSPPCEWFGPWDFWPWDSCCCHGSGEFCVAKTLLWYSQEEPEQEPFSGQDWRAINCEYLPPGIFTESFDRRSSIHWSIRWFAPCPGAWLKGLAMVAVKLRSIDGQYIFICFNTLHINIYNFSIYLWFVAAFLHSLFFASFKTDSPKKMYLEKVFCWFTNHRPPSGWADSFWARVAWCFCSQVASCRFGMTWRIDAKTWLENTRIWNDLVNNFCCWYGCIKFGFEQTSLCWICWTLAGSNVLILCFSSFLMNAGQSWFSARRLIASNSLNCCVSRFRCCLFSQMDRKIATLLGTQISPTQLALLSRWFSFSRGGICIRSLEGNPLSGNFDFVDSTTRVADSSSTACWKTSTENR